MSQGFTALVRRLERAQALQNERFNQASGGISLAMGGGFAHWRGPSHPLNQALGLVDPLKAEDLTKLEGFLGAPTVLELSPAADPDLWALLAERGYRLHQFQQQWMRNLAGCEVPLAAQPIRVALPEEEGRYNRLVVAGFLERDDWEDLDPPFSCSLRVQDAWGFLAFADGEPAGGGMLGLVEGVALLSGDGVLPRYRRRGLQKALIRARLAFAAARGCDLACASTAPGTASQRAYQACGFQAAYPKVEMARG